MCPEKQSLCAFVDGEVQHSERAAIDAHLPLCPACRMYVARLHAVRRALVVDAEPPFVDSMVRVRNRLEATGFASETSFGRLWHRRVRIPVPVFAAVALVMLVGGAALAYVMAARDIGTVSITVAPTGVRQLQITGDPEHIDAVLRALNKGEENPAAEFVPPAELRLLKYGEPSVRLPAARDVRWDFK